MTAPCLKIVDQYGRPYPRTSMIGEYEGAAMGRRMNTWGLSGSGVNATLFSSLSSLRSRTRELRRNNPLVDGGLDGYVANLIGTGIRPLWKLKDDPGLKKEIHELWDDWTRESDFNETLDLYGQQMLGASGMLDAGEFLSRFITPEPGEYKTIPLQLQLLEADHLDETYNSVAGTGNEIRMGIEIDKRGKRAAYHVWNEHPGECSTFQSAMKERIRVPKEDMLHVFKPVRIGQMRGRPVIASIIVKLHELDQYEDAELVRKKTTAMFGGFITQQSDYQAETAKWMGREKGTDDNGNTIIALEPGTFPELPVGKSVVFSTPADVGATYEVWIKQQLREIAVGMNITYEQLTGDLSGVNYSSIRAGLLEFRRRVEQLQYNIIIHQFCQPVAARFLDTAVWSGVLTIRDYLRNRRKYLRIEWCPDGWDWVDPVKDQVGNQMEVRNGFISRSRIVARRGYDIEEIDNEIAEDNARADREGLVLDSDPRRTAVSGAAQKAIDEAAKETGGGAQKGENKNET